MRRFLLQHRHQLGSPSSISCVHPTHSLISFKSSLWRSTHSSHASLHRPPRAIPPHQELTQISFNPPSTSSLPHPIQTSEPELDAFYQSLMSTPPSKFTQDTHQDFQPMPEHVPILGPPQHSISKPVSRNIPTRINQALLDPKTPIMDLCASPTPSDFNLELLSERVEQITISEWQSFLMAAAREQRSHRLSQILELLKSSNTDFSLVTDGLLSGLANLPELSVAKKAIEAVSEAYQEARLVRSSSFHQAQVHLLLYRSGLSPPSAFQAASDYVQRLEKAGTPPSPAVYLQLFAHLSYTSQRRACSVDLFHRVRLLAHPVPPISIWNAVLKALASGASTEPERSMDLFLDLKSAGLTPTLETYNNLIRAMARARRPPPGTSARRAEAEKWYFSSLRMLDRMIHEDGHRPDLHTYLALLEGSKRVGDLSRAKWIYGLFRQQLIQPSKGDPSSSLASENAHEEVWIHVRAVTMMMQTYASFTPKCKLTHHSPAQDASGSRRPVHTLQGPPSEKPSDHLDRPISVSDPMADYRHLPQTKCEAIKEADTIMQQFLTPAGDLRVQTQTRSDQRKLSILVGSYLSVYAAHGDIAGLHSAYERLTICPLVPLGPLETAKALRITWIYLLLLERCEYVRSAERAGTIGRSVFEEWLRTEKWQRAYELVESVEARLVSQLWAAWIRLQAKFGGVKEAMLDLERFVELYPIEKTSLETPYLVFRHVEVLHHRLKQDEDRQAVKRLTQVVKGYEKARLRAFEMKEEDRKTFAHSITAV